MKTGKIQSDDFIFKTEDVVAGINECIGILNELLELANKLEGETVDMRTFPPHFLVLFSGVDKGKISAMVSAPNDHIREVMEYIYNMNPQGYLEVVERKVLSNIENINMPKAKDLH